MTAPLKPRPRSLLLALPLLLLGVAGGSAFWVLLALALGAQCSWLAPLAALDAIVLLRLGGMPRGWPRTGWALLGTVATIALANWGIVATQVGLSTGLGPLDSAQRLGPSLAWTLAGLANGPGDLLWIALAIAISVIWR